MRKNSFMRQISATPYYVWAVLFIIVPIVYVLYYAFTDAQGNFAGFSNFQIIEHYASTFALSLMMAFIATVICLLIGYPLALAISRTKPLTQKILIMLVMLPMWINFIIRTDSIAILLEKNGLINQLLGLFGMHVELMDTRFAVIVGMVYDFLPYMVLPIYTTIAKLDEHVLEAAADLGCNQFKTLIKVILPLSTSGIVSGITMVFVPSISTFNISQKLGGGTFELIGDTIERQFQNVSTYNVGAAISLVMMILVLLSMAFMNKFAEPEGGNEN